MLAWWKHQTILKYLCLLLALLNHEECFSSWPSPSCSSARGLNAAMAQTVLKCFTCLRRVMLIQNLNGGHLRQPYAHWCLVYNISLIGKLFLGYNTKNDHLLYSDMYVFEGDSANVTGLFATTPIEVESDILWSRGWDWSRFREDIFRCLLYAGLVLLQILCWNICDAEHAHTHNHKHTCRQMSGTAKKNWLFNKRSLRTHMVISQERWHLGVNTFIKGIKTFKPAYLNL